MLAAVGVVAGVAANLPAVVLLGGAGGLGMAALLAYAPDSELARRFGLVLVGAAWLVAPFSGLKVAGPLLLSEAILVLPALVAVFPPGRSTPMSKAMHAFPIGCVLLIVLGGLLGTYIDDPQLQDLLHIGRLAANSLIPLIALRRISPSRRELELLTAAWVAGVLISDLVGLAGSVSPSGRTIGLTGHSNQLAMMSAMALPVILVLATRKGMVRTPRAVLSPPAIVVGVTLVFLVASVMSGARSGLLAIGVVGLLIGYRHIGAIASAVLGALFGAAILLSGVVDALSENSTSVFARLTQSDLASTSNEARGELLADQVDAIIDGAWLFGQGFATEGQRPHNLWLEIWGGAGLIGLVGLLCLVIPVVLHAVRRRGEVHPMTVALAIGFIGYLVALTFNNAFELPYMWTFFALWERWRWIPNAPPEAPAAPTSPSSEAPAVEPPSWPRTSPSTPRSTHPR